MIIKDSNFQYGDKLQLAPIQYSKSQLDDFKKLNHQYNDRVRNLSFEDFKLHIYDTLLNSNSHYEGQNNIDQQDISLQILQEKISLQIIKKLDQIQLYDYLYILLKIYQKFSDDVVLFGLEKEIKQFIQNIPQSLNEILLIHSDNYSLLVLILMTYLRQDYFKQSYDIIVSQPAQPLELNKIDENNFQQFLLLYVIEGLNGNVIINRYFLTIIQHINYLHDEFFIKIIIESYSTLVNLPIFKSEKAHEGIEEIIGESFSQLELLYNQFINNKDNIPLQMEQLQLIIYYLNFSKTWINYDNLLIFPDGEADYFGEFNLDLQRTKESRRFNIYITERINSIEIKGHLYDINGRSDISGFDDDNQIFIHIQNYYGELNDLKITFNNQRSQFRFTNVYQGQYTLEHYTIKCSILRKGDPDKSNDLEILHSQTDKNIHLFGQWHMNDYYQNYRRYYGYILLTDKMEIQPYKNNSYFMNKAIFYESRNPKKHIQCQTTYGKISDQMINFAYSEKVGDKRRYFIFYGRSITDLMYEGHFDDQYSADFITQHFYWIVEDSFYLKRARFSFRRDIQIQKVILNSNLYKILRQIQTGLINFLESQFSHSFSDSEFVKTTYFQEIGMVKESILVPKILEIFNLIPFQNSETLKFNHFLKNCLIIDLKGISHIFPCKNFIKDLLYQYLKFLTNELIWNYQLRQAIQEDIEQYLYDGLFLDEIQKANCLRPDQFTDLDQKFLEYSHILSCLTNKYNRQEKNKGFAQSNSKILSDEKCCHSYMKFLNRFMIIKGQFLPSYLWKNLYQKCLFCQILDSIYEKALDIQQQDGLSEHKKQKQLQELLIYQPYDSLLQTRHELSFKWQIFKNEEINLQNYAATTNIFYKNYSQSFIEHCKNKQKFDLIQYYCDNQKQLNSVEILQLNNLVEWVIDFIFITLAKESAHINVTQSVIQKCFEIYELLASKVQIVFPLYKQYMRNLTTVKQNVQFFQLLPFTIQIIEKVQNFKIENKDEFFVMIDLFGEMDDQKRLQFDQTQEKINDYLKFLRIVQLQYMLLPTLKELIKQLPKEDEMILFDKFLKLFFFKYKQIIQSILQIEGITIIATEKSFYVEINKKILQFFDVIHEFMLKLIKFILQLSQQNKLSASTQIIFNDYLENQSNFLWNSLKLSKNNHQKNQFILRLICKHILKKEDILKYNQNQVNIKNIVIIKNYLSFVLQNIEDFHQEFQIKFHISALCDLISSILSIKQIDFSKENDDAIILIINNRFEDGQINDLEIEYNKQILFTNQINPIMKNIFDIILQLQWLVPLQKDNQLVYLESINNLAQQVYDIKQYDQKECLHFNFQLIVAFGFSTDQEQNLINQLKNLCKENRQDPDLNNYLQNCCDYLQQNLEQDQNQFDKDLILNKQNLNLAKSQQEDLISLFFYINQIQQIINKKENINYIENIQKFKSFEQYITVTKKLSKQKIMDSKIVDKLDRLLLIQQRIDSDIFNIFILIDDHPIQNYIYQICLDDLLFYSDILSQYKTECRALFDFLSYKITICCKLLLKFRNFKKETIFFFMEMIQNQIKIDVIDLQHISLIQQIVIKMFVLSSSDNFHAKNLELHYQQQFQNYQSEEHKSFMVLAKKQWPEIISLLQEIEKKTDESDFIKSSFFQDCKLSNDQFELINFFIKNIIFSVDQDYKSKQDYKLNIKLFPVINEQVSSNIIMNIFQVFPIVITEIMQIKINLEQDYFIKMENQLPFWKFLLKIRPYILSDDLIFLPLKIQHSKQQVRQWNFMFMEFCYNQIINFFEQKSYILMDIIEFIYSMDFIFNSGLSDKIQVQKVYYKLIYFSVCQTNIYKIFYQQFTLLELIWKISG